MAGEWSTIHGQGKATRIAERTAHSTGGAFRRLEPGHYQGDNRRARPYEERSNGYRPYYREDQGRSWNYQSSWRDGGYSHPQNQGQSNWRQPYRDQPREEDRERPVTQIRPREEDHARPAVQTQLPAGGLEQVMTMLKAMQASITALETKQRGQEASIAPVQPRTEGPTRVQKQVSMNVSSLNGGRPVHSVSVGRPNAINTVPDVPSAGRVGGRDLADREVADRSTNPDFPKLCKAMFRSVQLQYHLGNWKALPKGIDRALHKVISNITPPMPNRDLSDRLLALTLEFKDKVARTVHDHISEQLVQVRVDSETLDNSEAVRAHQVVDQQLRRKLGKRLGDDRREELLADALSVVRRTRLRSVAEVGMGPVAHQPVVQTLNRSVAEVGIGPTAPQPVVQTLNRESTQVPGSPRSQEVGLGTGQMTPARRLTYAETVSPELAVITPAAPKKRRVTSPVEGRVLPLGTTVMDVTVIASDDEVDKVMSKSQRPGLRSSKVYNNVHRKTDEDMYTIQFKAACRVLILGDSQMKNLQGLPKDFQVESFCGARFRWLTEVLRKNQLPSSIKEIVLAAGINCREDDDLTRTLPELTECLDELRKTGRKLHFLGVNIPKGFEKRLIDNLEDLNDYVQAVQDVGFIERLPYNSVRTGQDGLHYDHITLDLITDQVKAYFLN